MTQQWFSLLACRSGGERSQYRDHATAGGGAVWTRRLLVSVRGLELRRNHQEPQGPRPHRMWVHDPEQSCIDWKTLLTHAWAHCEGMCARSSALYPQRCDYSCAGVMRYSTWEHTEHTQLSLSLFNTVQPSCSTDLPVSAHIEQTGCVSCCSFIIKATLHQFEMLLIWPSVSRTCWAWSSSSKLITSKTASGELTMRPI